MSHDNLFQSEQTYYFAGIAVTAAKLGIRLERLSVGDQYGLNGEAKLEPLESWCDSDCGENPLLAAKVEDYATTLLSGCAASYLHVQQGRCHLKRTFGDAGLEERFLRQVWHALQPELDRAHAIIIGSLGNYDDGNAEATARRLWHRAVRILHQPVHNRQLKRLAGHLDKAKHLRREEILSLLKT
jgi:hypothetical protein